MADFQASNWSRTAQPDHARVYLPQGQGFGIQAATVAANTTTIITATVPYQFQGNGQIEATIPLGQTNPQTGVSIGESILLSPSSGSLAAGNHPRVQFKVVSQIAATFAACSVLLVQY